MNHDDILIRFREEDQYLAKIILHHAQNIAEDKSRGNTVLHDIGRHIIANRISRYLDRDDRDAIEKVFAETRDLVTLIQTNEIKGRA